MGLLDYTGIKPSPKSKYCKKYYMIVLVLQNLISELAQTNFIDQI